MKNSKYRKAVNSVIDLLPNDKFKNPISTSFLYTLFDQYFELGFCLSTFRKTTVNPIPKGTDKGQRMLMNYRGISVLSCAGKLY